MPKLSAQSTIGTAYTLEMAKSSIVTSSHQFCGTLQITIFPHFDLPKRVVSNNGPTFISWEFKYFLRQIGVEHAMSFPYHPATNEFVERPVRTFKGGVKNLNKGDIHTKLARFLFSYRITPRSTTGVSPAQLQMGRRLRFA